MTYEEWRDHMLARAERRWWSWQRRHGRLRVVVLMEPGTPGEYELRLWPHGPYRNGIFPRHRREQLAAREQARWYRETPEGRALAVRLWEAVPLAPPAPRPIFSGDCRAVEDADPGAPHLDIPPGEVLP
jgi:hypothetical protein